MKHFWTSIQSVGNLSVDAADSRGWRTVHHAALHGQIKVKTLLTPKLADDFSVIFFLNKFFIIRAVNHFFIFRLSSFSYDEGQMLTAGQSPV